MSGFEVAGVVLAAFPLIISGIEHWRDCSKTLGYYWKVRKEYSKCRSDVQFHEILYKRNLKELLIPIVDEAAEVDLLVSDARGNGWKDATLERKLAARLGESYKVYTVIMEEMNETVEELRQELCFNESNIQDKLNRPDPKASRQPSSKPSKTSGARSMVDYHMFRAKFSLAGKKREELFARLKDCNERLEKLLNTSDKIAALESVVPTSGMQLSMLAKTFRIAYRKSELLFRALKKSWGCTCQSNHLANLRLEHRNSMDIYFELVLMFVRPCDTSISPWTWRELRCGGDARNCIGTASRSAPVQITHRHIRTESVRSLSASQQSPKTKTVAFSSSTVIVTETNVDDLVDAPIQLCQRLGEGECEDCIGVISHDDEKYHLHPFCRRGKPSESSVVTLDFVLSSDFDGFLSRRERYSIALLLASSVAQLQFTPWLRTGLAKTDVFFFRDQKQSNLAFEEPFIRQGFLEEQGSESESSAKECNFFGLGILLVELCFGKRLEDHPLRRKHADTGDADANQAFDLMAAIQWSRGVTDEGGEDYAAAVKWCFTGVGDLQKDWRTEMIKNVIRPLEACQNHFKTASMVG